MFGITWAGLNNLVYLPLVSIAGVLLVYRLLKWHRAVNALTAVRYRRELLLGFSFTRRVARTILFFIGILFLFFGLLRPQWNKRDEVVNQQGRDLFIALDVSRSMLASDCMPTRLACAKAKIKQLLQELSCERVGLIIFSGSTFMQCPLTTDYGAFLMFLNQIDAETISSGTTALDQAIKKALIAFQSLPERSNKLLVVLTDGEDFSTNLADVQQQARDRGLHIFALGVGTPEGAPVPRIDERGKLQGHQKDAQGNVVISKLNEPMLQKIANDSGGYYVRMASDGSDIKKIVSIVSSYEKEKFEDRTISRYEEQYPWFVAVSLFCFALEWIL